MNLSSKLLGTIARRGHPAREGPKGVGPFSRFISGESIQAKEATVSRAKGSSGVWSAVALLLGALTHLAGSSVLAQSQDPPAQPAVPASSAQPVGADMKSIAKSKLLQARANLAQGHLDVAEATTLEVARLKVTWMGGDDTPTRVLQDINQARQDPKILLQAARASLSRRDFGRAEQYARLADRHGSMLTFGLWGDSPGKVLDDIQKAKKSPPPQTTRAVATTAPEPKPTTVAPAVSHQDTTPIPVVQAGHTTPPGSMLPPLPSSEKPAEPAAAPKPLPPVPETKTVVSNETEETRALLKQAREKMSQSKFDEARDLVARARTKKANLGWWEDNPDRVESEIKRFEASPKPAAPAAPAPNASAPTPIPVSVAGVKTDAPEEVVPRTKEEARSTLAAGRTQMAEGKLDECARTVQRTKSLTTVTWGLFEDSPDRLALDLDKVRKERDRTEAARVLYEGRRAYEKGDLEEASRLAYRAQKLHGPYSIWDMGDRPSKLLADVQAAQARSRKTVVPQASLAKQEQKTAAPVEPVKPTAAKPVVESGDRLKAQQLVAEAQRLHRDGKLLEAQQKAVEAQKLNVAFGPDEVGPDFVYQQIAIEVRQRVDTLVRAAHEAVSNGQGDLGSRHAQAEKHLTDARTLAAQFGQDTQPIDGKLAQVRTMKPGGAVAQVKHETPASKEGAQILESARAELRKGETANARRLTEKALSGPYGVKDDAMALIRTIDAEESNQKQLGAHRAFDAALAAYRRREYSQASAMIATVDVRMLDADRQARLREISMTPEMSPSQTKATAKAATPAPSGLTRMGAELPALSTGTTPAPTTPATAPAATGTAVASDQGGDLLERHKQMQRIVFDKLRQDGVEAQRDAADKFKAGQTDAALEVLQDYLANLQAEKLEPGQLTVLRRPVESRLSHFRLLKAQKELAQGALVSKQTASDKLGAAQRAEDMKHKNVDKLMKDFNALYKDGKYLEAESMAMRALELDPDNGVASAAVFMARRQRSVSEYQKVKDSRNEFVRQGLNDAEDEGPAGAIKSGVEYSKDGWERAKNRKPNEPIQIGRTSEKAKAIERQLSNPLSISFDSTPLNQVLNELRDYHGINIVTDKPALDEAGVSLESPISIKLDRISLRSALNLILHQVRLTHVIRDEVLMVTTEENAKGKLTTVTHPVADLVIPIEDFGDVKTAGPKQPTLTNPTANFTPTPVTGPNSMGPGTPVGTPQGGSMLNGGGPQSTQSSNGTNVVKRGPMNTTEEQLIKLITSTIQPKTWSEMGGPGTIDYFPLTMSLVINQTADIQEQITDLLAALRRLQDQEVSVEVRFITVAEDFFERIGVNFNMNIQTHNQRFEPMLQQNAFVFDNSQFINAFRPGRFLAGLTPAGALTPTLDIPITQNSFFQTVPSFGGYNASGLTMGLAFLSDIQVFLFLEAAQGDTRTNVMQAPKLTLYNGQTSTINVTNSQNLVTGVQLTALPGGQFAILPQVTSNPFNSTSLTIQAVISADRRYVRMSITPTITNLLPGPGNTIGTFPIVVPVFTSLEGNGAGQPILLTQFIQQPTFANITISTTVAVPDGGTVLLGGLKSLSEARSEFGPPLLSKVPYISRLFRNVGYGRETESLLIMVTPRIIIQAEEEERQTNFREGTGGVGIQ